MFRKSLGTAVLGVAVVALGSTVALADAPPWTYVEAGYLNVDVEDLSGSGDNWFIGGAFGGEHWHVIGQYADGDLSESVERKDWRIGVGWHGLLGERADLLAEVYYVNQELRAPISLFDIDDDGYRLVGGVRWRPISLFEADGFINYTDLDSDSQTSYELRAILNIWRIGIGASYETSSDFDQYNGFVRFSFGGK